MSFAWHDPYWTAVLQFVQRHRRPDESVMAPDLFWWGFDRIERYTASFARSMPRPRWVIVHKGQLEELSEPLLRGLPEGWRPLFANEVFVVWAQRPDLPALPDEDPHLGAYHHALERATFRTAAPPEAFRHVLPEPDAIQQFSSLDEPALAAAMDRFYEQGGYRYETPRDRAYYGEIDRAIDEMGGGPPDRRVLDLCCGEGRVLQRLGPFAAAFGLDLSRRAVEAARRRFQNDGRVAFAVAAAERLPLADESVDQAFWIDAIEHVRSPGSCLRELRRVLRPGGRVLVTAANRDSLNQRIQRKLGYPDFVTNYQHFAEFTVQEVREQLRETGFRVVEERGIMLYPLWGVPGIDPRIHTLLDEDPELVEVFRLLGERAGSEFAYTFVLLAELAARKG